MRARIVALAAMTLAHGAIAYADPTPVSNSAPAAGTSPRKPGVYPVLVIAHDDSDAHDRAYVLGCARVTKSGSKLLGPRDCTTLLANAKLELVDDDGKRAAVQATTKWGIGNTCPERAQHERFIQLKGLPADTSSGIIVGAGIAALAPDPKTEPAIEKVYPKTPGKRPGDNGWGIDGSFDLDGDGRAEVVTSFLGAYILWSADGKKIGVVGCSLG